MKKLIAMLNTFTLLASTLTSVVSCSEEKGKHKKQSKKHKQDEQDNEDNEDNEDDKTEQSLASIMEQIKTNLTVAIIKADDTNTILELTNEVKSRVEKIIEGKSVSFELTINNNEQSESKLEQKSYQFNIKLSTITSQDNEEENNDNLMESFSIAVKSLDINLEQQQMMKQLEQLDQQIEVILLKKVLIADGVNTYKDVKDMIKTELTNLALSKDTVLQIEFTNSIFKEDNELIYKSDNPFEVKIDLIAKEDNQLSLSKTYKITTVEGVTKEYLEDKKDKDLQYNTIREVIKNMFANETFTDNISALANIKADGEHTVKDVITALNNLDNAKVFGENQDINKYKFQYNTVLELDDKLVVDGSLAIIVYAFDKEDNQPFYDTNFDFKVFGENDLDQYERITKKITKYLNNKEVDLSSFTELNADGKVQWNQTLSNIVKPDKIYDYFNFKLLGEDFKTEYANIVDFDLSLDNEKKDDMDNNYFTYNSEQRYVPVKLKLSKKGSTDSIYKVKHADLNIKVGGWTGQQIYQKQEEAVKKLEQLIIQQNFKFTEDSFHHYWSFLNFKNATYKNLINNFLIEACSYDKEILAYLIAYLDFDALITSKEDSKILTINDYYFDCLKIDVTIELHMFPRGTKVWKNNGNYIFQIMENIKKFLNAPTHGAKTFEELLGLAVTSELRDHWWSDGQQIIFKKKDTINEKQLTYKDLYKKHDEDFKNFMDKAPLYIKRIAEAVELTIRIYKGDQRADYGEKGYINPITEGSSELREGIYTHAIGVKDFKCSSGGAWTPTFIVKIED